MRRNERLHGVRFLFLVASAACITALAHASPPSRQDLAGGQRRSYVESDRLVRLTMEVPVEPERVFDAWTNAAQLVEWFCHWAEMTVTEGGPYRLGWDGYEAVWEGTYVEVDRPNKLAFTWNPPAVIFPAGAYPTTITLTFEDLDGATRMVMEQSGFQGAPEMESSLELWRSYLYTLRAFLLQSAAQ